MNEKRIDKDLDILPTTFYHPPKWRNSERDKACNERIEKYLKAIGFKPKDSKSQ